MAADLALAIIHATGGDPKRAPEAAAVILASPLAALPDAGGAEAMREQHGRDPALRRLWAVRTPARQRYSRKLLSGPKVIGQIGCGLGAARQMVEAGLWASRPHRWSGRTTAIYSLTDAGRRALDAHRDGDGER